ncbi:adenylate kinase 8-like [Anthonomus grandis grandis]|uniref:adenylate kinase 8-like n=1 Tax=Anthonomus grandis grandis TaxID=2921223 RepID=UPI0021655B5A|nr:adenylate kinase 8-like [Anthonomus grandis grandis]
MTDPSKRPLQFPKWHIPYLEKHRIPELFYEIARELVIQKPEDHLLFIKQILQQASASRDSSRVILIGSLKINRVAVAEHMAKLTQQVVITKSDLKNIFEISTRLKANTVAKALACLVRSQNISSDGWIIADCINTEEEAKALLKLGVLPTHVIHLIIPFQPKLDELLYCDVPEQWPQLRRNLFGLKQVFNKKLREIPLTDKDLTTLAEECVVICSKKEAIKHVKPRVVLFGPRGSGRKTQAKLLQEMLGLVHVDFEYLLCQAWISETELGEKLRKCNRRVCFHSELLCQIINKRILEKDALDNGWVLTGFPYTVTDLQFLDSLQTPPNRIIVLELDLKIAAERINNRYTNVYTGSITKLNLPQSEDNKKKEERIEIGRKILKQHPKDTTKLTQAEHDFYCQNYGEIKKYCGSTFMVVCGEPHERWVYECIVGHIIGPNPPGPPRKGFGVEIPEVCSCDCIHIPSAITKTYTMNI